MTMGPTLPMDIFVHIIEFIDDLKDLLAFASTSRALHALIVPRHSDYRRIVCAESATHVWEHLLTTLNACSYVRYLNTTTTHNLRTDIPRLCPIDWDFAVNSSLHLNFGTPLPLVVDKDAFLQALSEMVNLKVLAFETAGRGQIPIGAISEAIENAGCDLEEIDVYFQFINEDEETLDLVDEGDMFVRYYEENKYSENPRGFSLLYDYLPSLRRYFIYADTFPESNVFLQMLLNAPNLTHINVTHVCAAVFLLGYWPNLQHLVYPCDTLKNNRFGHDYTPGIRMFFSRHSKLITLHANYVLVPGWAIESDSFLPNLKSLGIPRLTSEAPMLTFHIGTRLTHVDMNTELCSYLKDNGIVLYNLESCRYWNADPRASTQDLVDIIPNIKKLYMLFGYYQGTNRQLTTDEIMERVTPFSGLKSLRILIGLFDTIDIDDHFLEFLHSMPSLVYTRVRDKKYSSEQSILRLERDNIARAVRYELMKVVPDECNMRSWGGFYRRGIRTSAELMR